MAGKLDKVTSVTYGASLSQGGWEATLRIADDADAVADWQKIEIWQKDVWNGVSEGYKEVMVGYAMPKEFSRDWVRGDFDVLVATSQRMLKNMECQYIAFLEDATPANSHELVSLTLGNMITHVLDSHTNIIYDASTNPEGWARYENVNTTVGGTFTWFGFGRERGLVLIWTTIASLATAYGLICYFDKGDNLFWGPHPMFDSPLPSKIVTFDNELFTSIKILERGQEDRVKQVIMTGEQDDGTTIIETWPDLTAPPDTDWYYGHDESGQIRCNSAAELEDVAERKQKFANRDYDVVLETWGLWDLELGDRVGITYVNAADGIDWDDKDFYVESIQVTLEISDASDRRKKTKLVLNEGV